MLASPLGIAALKTLSTQLGYETASTAAYLGVQEVARGGGFKGAIREIRTKFWKAWKSGTAFFSASQLLMFLVPLWWLQPLLDNIACLGFNTYLAMLSHDDDEEDVRTAVAEAYAVEEVAAKEVAEAEAKEAAAAEFAAVSLAPPQVG